jgi:hypothetical protein
VEARGRSRECTRAQHQGGVGCAKKGVPPREGEESRDRARGGEEYPLVTTLTPELLASVESLLELFEEEEPLTLPVRPTDAGKLRYFTADASAEGFGSAIQYPDGSTSRRDGLWMPAFPEGGSNLCEATAQVNHILVDVHRGRHDDCEVWYAIDNAVWSYVWHKGMSSA